MDPGVLQGDKMHMHDQWRRRWGVCGFNSHTSPPPYFAGVGFLFTIAYQGDNPLHALSVIINIITAKVPKTLSSDLVS